MTGLQMMLDPAGTAAHALPFWFSRELATYAIDHAAGGYLWRGLLHGATFAAAVLTLVMFSIRLHRRPHLQLAPLR